MKVEKRKEKRKEKKSKKKKRPLLRGGVGFALRDFSKAIPMALLRAREAAISHFRPVLRDYDLTEQQWRILRALADRSELEVLDLSRITFLKPTSLSRILPKLERRALCSRRKPLNDQRRVIIELAPGGQLLLKALGPTYEAIYADIARRFGKARLAQFVRLAHEFEVALVTCQAGVDRP